ncbi:MAG: kelch motif-containing protein [bacterium]|nr:kelch motif-containing protein [bacterium]
MIPRPGSALLSTCGLPHPLLAFAVTFAIAAGAGAQSVWLPIPTSTSPTPRSGHAMAYDPIRDEIVLFGGATQFVVDDTWIFDGASWTQRSPATVPLARTEHALVFVPNTGTTLMYGGRDTNSPVGFLDDTWEWNGTDWSRRMPANTPPARAGHGLAWSSNRNRAVLFGGYFMPPFQPPTARPLTWEWDHVSADWELRSPAGFASASHEVTLTEDPVTGHATLYGGQQHPSEMWGYDGLSWYRLLPQNHPGPRIGSASVADHARDRMILFGGSGSGQTTWEWNGQDWSQNLAPGTSPTSRSGHAMVWDSLRERAMLFGGIDPSGTTNNETWTYLMTNPATISQFGNGCFGPRGQLRFVATNRPWTGDTFRAEVAALATNGITFGLAGFSNFMWAGGALPQALATIHPAGAPNCFLAVRPDATLVLPSNPNGTASFALPIPNSAALAGVLMYLQAIDGELDATGNLTVIRSTGGLAITVGVR